MSVTRSSGYPHSKPLSRRTTDMSDSFFYPDDDSHDPELRCAWCGGPEPEGGWVEMAPNFRICSYECSENY